MTSDSENIQNIEPQVLNTGEIKFAILLFYVLFMFMYSLLTFGAAILLFTKIESGITDNTKILSGITDYLLIVVSMFGVYLILCLSRLPFSVNVNNGNMVTYSIRGRRTLNLHDAKSVSVKTAIHSTTFLKKSNFNVLKIVDSAGKVGFLNTYVLRSADKNQLCTAIVSPLRKAGISNLVDDGKDIWLIESD